MRSLVLSVGFCVLVPALALAQAKSSQQQLPVGQTFKNFEFPLYQGGQLKATLLAVTATGITQNRAETIDLKIDLYDNGVKTTTITSPKADLYVAERKMRSKSTVQISRADLEATAQSCDFDLSSKKYILRTNVKVVLKNFDSGTKGPAQRAPAPAEAEPTTAPVSVSPPKAPSRPSTGGSLLDTPGGYSDTNSAPVAPTDIK